MLGRRSAWLLWALTLLATAAVAIVVTWLVTRSAKRPVHAAALPPPRQPTKGDMAIARLLNAMNAEMRSVELGRWFMEALRLRAPAGEVHCNDLERAIDYEAVAWRVPGINEVAARETVDNLRELVRLAALHVCDLPRVPTTTGTAFVRVLDRFEESAFGDDGVLLGMPGYSVASSKPLPPP